MMSTCIWCKSDTHDEPEEHVLPEGLVGEARFTVTGKAADEIRLVLKDDEVCWDCNVKRLSPLDGYLQKQLGIFKVFLNRTETKRGKPAKVEKPGVYAIHRSDGPHIYLNAERKQIVADDGIVIQPPKDHPEAVRLTGLKKIGPMGELNFTVNIRFASKWFFRALHKIAFEMLCFQEGVAFVLDPRFDPIRDYVLRGRGSREIFTSRALHGGEWETPGVTLHKIPETGDWIVALGLGPMFLVDVSPEGGFAGEVGKELRAKGVVRLSDKPGTIAEKQKETDAVSNAQRE